VSYRRRNGEAKGVARKQGAFRFFALPTLARSEDKGERFERKWLVTDDGVVL
jgi:hypothetical protein